MIHDMNHYGNESLSSGGVMPNPNETPQLVSPLRHAGPHLGALAIVYTVLFNAGLYPVTIFASKTHFSRSVGTGRRDRVLFPNPCFAGTDVCLPPVRSDHIPRPLHGL